ncbi:M23 family metallopeptidase [Bacillus sp. 2205SS5-2]|uniref:M23 family metallopeptidase n=1 Tax=Bacillus sp. 2205SS5-2 TaxID=3109031 RepID=UPI0030053CE6
MREEEKNRSSQQSRFQAFFKKRWAYPAIYLASAAIIITAILWYQSAGDELTGEPQDFGYVENGAVGQKKYDDPAVPVNALQEMFQMPVKDPNKVVIEKQFYDPEASAEEQEAALVFFENTFYENTGIDISMKGEEFDVLAAMSGTVTAVEEDPLLGHYIIMEHSDGVATRYQSVKAPVVSVGDSVNQGDTLGKAGQSKFNEEAGVHVHFEIRKDSVALNPIEFFDKPLSAIKEQPGDEGENNEGQHYNYPEHEEFNDQQDSDDGDSADDADGADSDEDDN